MEDEKATCEAQNKMPNLQGNDVPTLKEREEKRKHLSLVCVLGLKQSSSFMFRQHKCHQVHKEILLRLI